MAVLLYSYMVVLFYCLDFYGIWDDGEGVELEGVSLLVYIEVEGFGSEVG